MWVEDRYRYPVRAHMRPPEAADLLADRPCGDGAPKRERRGNGRNGFRALANALNGEVAVVHKTAKNALVDIDALNFVEAHLKGPPPDETGLVDLSLIHI